MPVQFETTIAFSADPPSPELNARAIDELLRHASCVEGAEICWRIEFSCGDGKYLSDLTDEEFPRYDDCVDWSHPPRDALTGTVLAPTVLFQAVEERDGSYSYRYMQCGPGIRARQWTHRSNMPPYSIVPPVRV